LALAAFAATIAVALAGPRLELLAAASTQYFKDVHAPASDYAYAFTLPISVVQAAYPGWNVVAILWATLALLTVLGLTFSRILSGFSGKAGWIIIAGFVLVGGALSFAPIMHSTDAYYYVMYGRIYGLLGINPYVLPAPVPAGNDPTLMSILRFAHNPPFPSPYGPLWTLVSGGLALLESSAGLWLQAYTYRLLAIASGAALLGAVLYASRRQQPETAPWRVARIAFHPLFLYETAVGAHNDITMVAPAVWAFAILESRPLIAALLLGGAIGIKYVAALALPFLAVRALRQGWLTAVLVVIIAAAVPLLCGRPFYAGASGGHGLGVESGYFSMSLTWLLEMPLFASGVAQGAVIPGLPALPFIGVLSWARVVQLAVVASFLAVAVVSLARDIRLPNYANLWRSFTALLWALPLVHPWYGQWLIAGIARRDRWGTYIWWLAAALIGLYAVDSVSAAALPAWALIALTCGYLLVPIGIALLARREEKPAQT
jgi:hypothetical protein